MKQHFIIRSNHRNRIILIPLMLVFGIGCVYFNLFYNAEQSYKDAIKIIEETPLTDDGELPAQAVRLLDTAIKKSNKVIDQHEESKYVDDAIFITGRANFFKKNFVSSQEDFNKLIIEHPSSPFVIESKIWLANCHLELGLIDSATYEINELLSDKMLKNNEQYLALLVLGEIKLTQDSLHRAFEYFEKATTFTSKAGKKSSVYARLVKLSEDNKDFNSAVHFLKLLETHTQSNEIRLNAKMKWIEYNRIIGNYDAVLNEIESMLSLSEYESLYLSLELERAKISFDRQDYEIAKRDLSFMAEKYSKKKETAAAYYYLGYISLFSDLDMERAKEYFMNVTTEYNRSDHKMQAGFYLSKIERYTSIRDEYEELLEKYIPIADTTFVELDSLTIDTLESKIVINDSVELEIDKNVNLDSLLTGINENTIIDSLSEAILDTTSDLEVGQINDSVVDSLLFTMAEIMVFDFARNKEALDYYEELVLTYPDSKFVPQSLYILSEKSNEQDKWLQKLKTDFPNSEYLKTDITNSDLSSDVNDFENLINIAWETLEKNPQDAHDQFLAIYEQFRDTLSVYIAATISDYYLQEFQKALTEYSDFAKKYPNHEFANTVKNRLDELEKNLEDQLSVYEAELHFNKGINSLQNSFDPDTASFYFEEAAKTKVASGLRTLSQNYKTKLQQHQKLSDKLYHTSLEIDSLANDSTERGNENLDSLHYFMGELFYNDLHKPDSAENHYIKVIQDYPKSNFRANSLIAMKKLQPDNDWDVVFINENSDSLYNTYISEKEEPSKPLQIITDNSMNDLQWEIESHQLYLDNFTEIVGEDTLSTEIDSTLVTQNDIELLDTLLVDSTQAEIIDSSKVLNYDVVLLDTTSLTEGIIQEANVEEQFEDSTAFLDDSIIDSIAVVGLIDKHTKYYLILPGDNLFQIALKEYKDIEYWKQIYDWNIDDIGDNPNRIFAYQQLILEFDEHQTQKEPNFVIYFVKRFDTLWSIADRFYGDPYAWSVIYRDNEILLHENDGILIPKMELRIRETLTK
ncbi:MAG: LysM peptidoglycan-binding domain-containing protein [Candidatus Marinimicrobia bacterium]|nr:LysM peptidoglycan-binding domain-containing protein [Candidatus Neomarinimicrobiota bacterium]MBL7022747.1 LysM peptidoglycan-binding domain-containing protein [Candidatus Neomarinimicrobiota bacterium]MBL7109615.1 LysM peptidoglycan-binding domain-containing protein [Candidatus Neomarinimicrobiota bacterium]